MTTFINGAVETLNRSLTQHSQDWELDGLYRLGEHKLRVSIRRNAYDFQSHAYVSWWTGSGWTQIATLAPVPAEMHVLRMRDAARMVSEVSYVQKFLTPDGEQYFREDEERLLDLAAKVLL